LLLGQVHSFPFRCHMATQKHCKQCFYGLGCEQGFAGLSRGSQLDSPPDFAALSFS